jgi:serine/threonine-protein kinase
LIGLGAPKAADDFGTAAVLVAGTNETSGAVAHLDLSKPVTVSISGMNQHADHLRFRLKVLGQSLTSSTVALAEPASGSSSVSFDLSGSKYIVAGKVTGEVDLISSGTVVASDSFPVKTAQSGAVSAVGGAVLLLLLLAVAYLESNLKALRRGKRKVSGTISLVVIGAVSGVVIAGIVWVVAGVEPQIAGLVACAAAGALSAGAAAIGAARVGKRRKTRTKAKAAVTR